MTIHSRHSEEATTGDTQMGGTCIPRVAVHKHLGVHVNESLAWTDRIDAVYTKCAQRLGILRRLKRRLHRAVLRKIFIGSIQPIFEYACSLWCGGPTARLKNLHASFCRRHNIKLAPLQSRFEYHSLLLFFKMHSNIAPPYLCSLLPSLLSSTSGYGLRKLSYPIPIVKKKSSLSHFLPRTIMLWNALPKSLQECKSIAIFKKKLRSHLHL